MITRYSDPSGTRKKSLKAQVPSKNPPPPKHGQTPNLKPLPLASKDSYVKAFGPKDHTI